LGILISPFFSNLKLFTESNQNKVKTFLISKYMIGIFLLVINFIFAKSNLHFMNILDLKINYKFFNQLLFPFLIIILFGFFQFLVVILIAKPILYFSDKVIFPKIKKEKQKLSLPEELIDVPTVLSLQHLKDEVLKQLAMIQSFTSDLKEVFKEKKVKKDNNKRILKYKTIIKNFNLEFNQYVTNLSQQELMYSQRKELEKTKLIQSEASKILYDIFDLYTIIETCLSSDVFKEEKYSYEYLKSYIISIERSFEMLFELSYEETNIANQKKEYMAFNREVKYSIFVHSENDKITQALFSIYLLMKDIEKSMTNLNHLLAR
jgi:Na+/phosphate symporter